MENSPPTQTRKLQEAAMLPYTNSSAKAVGTASGSIFELMYYDMFFMPGLSRAARIGGEFMRTPTSWRLRVATRREQGNSPPENPTIGKTGLCDLLTLNQRYFNSFHLTASEPVWCS